MAASGIDSGQGLVQRQGAGEHRGAQHGRGETGALFVGPHGNFQGFAGLDTLVVEAADHLQASQHPVDTIEAPALGLRVEVAADHHRRRVLIRSGTPGEQIAVWTNEEGARFTPAMLGSAVFTGTLALDKALATVDAAGVSVAEALRVTGYNGSRPLGGTVDAYFEAHIEQGPILEDNAKSIGVVTGGQAIRWLDVRVEGMAAHAGTTPMPLRKDALYGAAQMIQALETLAADFAPEGLTTVGELSIAKSSRNTIPGLLSFTVDLRHHRDSEIDAMERQVRQQVQAIAEQRGLTVTVTPHWISPATPFDAECVACVQTSVDALGYSQQRIVSGAGHDAIHLARYCPTAMIFIPCVGGLSHNEAEDVLPEDVRQGTDVLLNAVLKRAGQAQ